MAGLVEDELATLIDEDVWNAAERKELGRRMIPLGLEEGRRPHSEQVWVI
jgi:hypothetical protein